MEKDTRAGAIFQTGGHIRVGLEDTFYLPGGDKAPTNAALVEELVKLAREAGREIASTAKAREFFGMKPVG